MFGWNLNTLTFIVECTALNRAHRQRRAERMTRTRSLHHTDDYGNNDVTDDNNLLAAVVMMMMVVVVVVVVVITARA